MYNKGVGNQWSRGSQPLDQIPGMGGLSGSNAVLNQHSGSGGFQHALGMGGQAGPVALPFGPQYGVQAAAAFGAQQMLHQQAAAAAAVVNASLQLQQQQQLLASQAQGLGNLNLSTAPPSHASSGSGSGSQRCFTGIVTKLQDNYGFVDNEVYFQFNVVKGQLPLVNDRVLVEANYNSNMPCKWNATRIQMLPNQRGTGQIDVGGSSGPSISHANSGSKMYSKQSGGHQMQQSSSGKLMGQSNNASHYQHPGNQMSRDGMYGVGRDHGYGGGGSMSRSEPRNRLSGGSPNPRGGGRSSGNISDKPDFRSGFDRGRDTRMSQRSNMSRDKMDRQIPSLLPSSAVSSMSNSRKRSRSPPPLRRTRSRSRSRSPRRRIRPAVGLRYSVTVPKISLDFPESNVMELRKRYNNMYVPSDFFMANHTWIKSFPIHNPFKLHHHNSAFYIFNKGLVDPVDKSGMDDSLLEPPDVDYSFSAKVMLMASPPPDELFSKTCHMPTESFQNRDQLIHPTRAVQFLIGMKGKGGAMAIGGPWSPSLDGSNPAENPAVLIKTAIRTCLALTGIDLSGCTLWRKFVEIHYRRSETTTKPARTETSVIYMPDVWSLMPKKTEFDVLRQVYEDALAAKLDPVKSMTVIKVQEDEKKIEVVEKLEPELEPEVEITDEDEIITVQKSEVIHWSKLNIKNMKVNELKEQLEARGLNAKGVKAVLSSRLQKALKQEEVQEEEADLEVECMDIEIDDASTTAAKEGGDNLEDDRPNEKSESLDVGENDKEEQTEDIDECVVDLNAEQKEALINVYKMPVDSCILVHPNGKAKQGKFDCTVSSLSILLDYRIEDKKEGNFEVSVFAELFNEMMMRDAGYNIYKAILNTEPKVVNVEPKISEETLPTTETSSLNSVSNESTEMAKKRKISVVDFDKELLMSFSYFDLGHGGYFSQVDLEDILLALNLNLSRSQVKRLVTKACNLGASGASNFVRDQFNYRILTDRTDQSEVVSTQVGEPDDEKLGMGFKLFLPQNSLSEPSKCQSMEGGDYQVAVVAGAVVNVSNLVRQLERCDEARSTAERLLSEAQNKLTDLTSSVQKHTAQREKLQTECRELRKKLRSAEDDLRKARSDASHYFTTLKDIHVKINPFLHGESVDAQTSVEDFSLLPDTTSPSSNQNVEGGDGSGEK